MWWSLVHAIFSVCGVVCSEGAERGVWQTRAETVAGMVQRRPVRRRGHERHQHRHLPGREPGHQVRLLRPRQHRLPHRPAVSSTSSLQILLVDSTVLHDHDMVLFVWRTVLMGASLLLLQENVQLECNRSYTRSTEEPHAIDQFVWTLNFLAEIVWAKAL